MRIAKILLIILFFIPYLAMARVKPAERWASCLTGGTTGCVDKLNESALIDGDIIKVFNTTIGNLNYIYDDDSGATEDGITVITPDDATGDGRWVLLPGNGKVTIADQAALEALITNHTTSHEPLGLSGQTITISDGDNPIDIPVGVFELNGGGATIDCSAVTSGYCVRFVPSISDSDNALYAINDLTILGPDSDSSGANGVYIGRKVGGAGNTAGVVFNNLEVYGFDTGVFLGTYTWLNTFNNLRVHDAHEYGMNLSVTTGAGEIITFIGGAIYNCTNDGGTSTALYAPAGGAGDYSFNGFALDYNDKTFYILDGSFQFSGCHIEDNNANPFGYFEQDSSRISAIFIGGKVTPHTEKNSWFDISGDNIFIDFNTPYFYTFGVADGSELFTVSDGEPVITWNNLNMSAENGSAPRLSSMYNALDDGGFESGDTSYWNVNTSSGNSFTVDAVTYRSGSYSLKSTGSGDPGDTNASVTQVLSCKVGDSILISVYAKTALTAGYATVRILWYSYLDQLIETDDFSTQHVSETTDWTRISGYRRAPAGAKKANIQLYSYQNTGDIYWDDAEVWNLNR